MTNQEVAALFDIWNNALATNDPKKVAECYANDAILLPTVSNQVRHNHAEIEDYFVHFLAKGPQGVIDESNIRVFEDCGVAIHSGVYTFTFKDGNKVQGRFTFVYRHEGENWKIIEHHSSAMPE